MRIVVRFRFYRIQLHMRFSCRFKQLLTFYIYISYEVVVLSHVSACKDKAQMPISDPWSFWTAL